MYIYNFCETTSARSADGEGAAKRPPRRWLNSFATYMRDKFLFHPPENAYEIWEIAIVKIAIVKITIVIPILDTVT